MRTRDFFISLIIVSIIVLGSIGIKLLKSSIFEYASNVYSSDWRVQSDYGVQSCDFSPDNSIITEIEINKVYKNGNPTYKMKCVPGPRYNYTKYYYFKFCNCSESDAKLIDSSVRKKNDCFFSLNNPIPDDVTNYIVIIAQCVPDEKVSVGISCLPGKPHASVFYAVYDIKSGKLYY